MKQKPRWAAAAAKKMEARHVAFKEAREKEELEKTIPLKKVADMAGLEPREARRLLRTRTTRPEGRWEWPAKRVPEIVALLKTWSAKEKDNG